MSHAETGAPVNAASVLKQFRIVSLVTAVLLLIQAALAGQGWFVDYDLIKIHGYMGNATFIAGLALVGIAFSGQKKGVLDRTDLIISILMLVLIMGQFGLGYGGRDSNTAAALHWPNGVLITLLTATLLGRSLPRRN